MTAKTLTELDREIKALGGKLLCDKDITETDRQRHESLFEQRLPDGGPSAASIRQRKAFWSGR